MDPSLLLLVPSGSGGVLVIQDISYKGNFAGCRQHRGTGALVWRRGLPNFDFEVQNVVKAIKNDRREYREKGNAYMLPQELHAIRDSMVSSGSLENLQLWVMIILATKLFLRADEVLNLKINDPEDPENPEKTENCVNWRLTSMVNGDITRLAFSIRGKTDKAGSVTLTIWEETTINKLDAIRPLLAYIHLAKLKGGYLFPCADELSKLRNGEGGIGRRPMSYNTFLDKLKAACKPHVLDRDSFGTHTLRKTAYALAVFGGASDIEIMNAARHKCTKSASTYKQDAFYMYQLCQETANGLSLDASTNAIEAQLSLFAPKWRSIFILHAQLAAGINRLQAPKTHCLKTIADDFIRRRCGLEAGTVFGTVTAVVEAATHYKREATKKEILRQKLEEIQKTDIGLASDLQKLFLEVIAEERSEAVSVALRQAGVLPTPKLLSTPSATPTRATAPSKNQITVSLPETLVAPVPPLILPSSLPDRATSPTGGKRKRTATNNLDEKGQLKKIKCPKAKLEKIFELEKRGRGDMDNLTEG
ncbi:hypothetical protein HDU96_003446, partial [Phlyctochytrium bullatum]